MKFVFVAALVLFLIPNVFSVENSRSILDLELDELKVTRGGDKEKFNDLLIEEAQHQRIRASFVINAKLARQIRLGKVEQSWRSCRGDPGIAFILDEAGKELPLNKKARKIDPRKQYRLTVLAENVRGCRDLAVKFSVNEVQPGS